MYKKAYSIQMSYEITDKEKELAEKALILFDNMAKKLDIATNHLNIMKVPFEENPEMDAKSVMESRVSLRAFRDQSIQYFADFKIIAFECVKVMQTFKSDTQIEKLIRSFVSSVEELEKNINKYIKLYDNLESKEFSKDVVKNINEIQDKAKTIKELVEDRLEDYIVQNILVKTWVDSVSKNIQVNIEKKVPLMMDLFNKRQDDLNKVIKNKQ